MSCENNTKCIPLCLLFNGSLQTSVFPKVWKTSRVTSIFKSSDPSYVTNYRPTSDLPLIGKLFEFIVLRKVISYLLQ